jgi:acyl transferase domain-containing protein/NAD(P)-dependent dehydrogenase (short-subunit alcohol dehydrogenase family)/NAD(P)H-dependent flavin oxidoreductase YrpB (nitropropane dioxygenase family)/acyl carrier protein
MEPHHLIVLTPAGDIDPTIAIAACRAGAVGVLDLEYVRVSDGIAEAASRLARFGGPAYGVLIRADDGDLLSTLLALPVRPARIVLTGPHGDGLSTSIQQCRNAGVQVLREVIDLEAVREAVEAGIAGVILKGQEAGGRVGADTSFVLVQMWRRYADRHGVNIPFWVRGGIGPNTAAACARAGAQGVVLDSQVLLARESSLPGAARGRIAGLDGSETTIIGARIGERYRVYNRADSPAVQDLMAEEERLLAQDEPLTGLQKRWIELVRARMASRPELGIWPVGQDVGLASGLAARGVTVAGIVQAICDVCRGSAVKSTRTAPAGSTAKPDAPPPCDVAIIGLSCFYPKAANLWQYWENILAKVNAVTEIPPSHWDWRPYYDPDPRARDKMVSKWGGFMSDITFDPLKYGITPKSIPNIEPLQLLLLEAVNQALGDAGYLERPFNRERTCAILGVGGGGMPLSVAYGFRACMPLIDSIPGVPVRSSQIVELGQGILPEWTEDSFPGILLNVAAGRVANRFNLGGPNMAIDAACGSSLAALYAGVRELNDGTSDVAIVMGGDAVQTPYAYVAFSKTHALSPRGRCRPFDAAADGIALAEGVGVAVLKRLADAERDGDRIYAVIKGVGASSDGRDKGLTAPRAEGQIRALERAYSQARVSPARVGLVEAHGTGTVVGDQTEARAIGELFRSAGGQAQYCALGSVKSMIGHSKCAAGLAGLIKAAFALHYRTLPPTLVEAPNTKANLEGGPLYLNTEARPWIHGADHPRTAGVSAFGFGGTNFHAVLEEYTGDYLDRPRSALRQWPAELLVWRRSDRAALLNVVKSCRDALAAGAAPRLADFAASVWHESRENNGQATLAVVATSLDDLKGKLDIALESVSRTDGTAANPRGIYFAEKFAFAPGQVAFLFPGQGSQYPNMLAELGMAFPEVREVLDRAEQTLADVLDRPLGKLIYPPSHFTPEQEAANRKQLQRTEVAQPAVGAASLAMHRLLTTLGITADVFAGHSYGEYTALAAAGAISESDLVRLSYLRGRLIRDAAANTPGGMIAVDAAPTTLEPLLQGLDEVWTANHNAPSQVVLAGTEAGLKRVEEKLKASSVRSQRIPVACGFHSPLVANAKEELARTLAGIAFAPPRKPVFSNTTAAPHALDPARIIRQLADHLISPVRFADEIEAMYDAGARVFVEVGPQAVLTGLAGQILDGKPHLVLATDVKSRSGLVQLAHALGQLLTAGIPVDLDRLFEGRGVQPFDTSRMGPDTGRPVYSPTTWVVNSVRSRPLNGPEPRLLGQPLPERAHANGVSRHPAETRKVDTPASTSRKVAGNSSLPVSPARVAAAPAVSFPPRTIMNDIETPTAPLNPTTSDSPGSLHAASDTAAVMARFQDVMARFLDTQRSVMLAFLGSGEAARAAPSLNGSHSRSTNGAVLYSPPPPPVNRLADPVADVGSQQSSNGNGQPTAPFESTGTPEVNGKPTASQGQSAGGPLNQDELLARLIDLVSDRTGYPKEALSIDLDLEADLGIDSIKRVEILGALAESMGESAQGSAPQIEMEKLSVIKTMRGIADYMAQVLALPSPQPSANGTAKPDLAPSRNGELHPGARQGEVQRLVVQLIDAPLPVRPRFAPPTGTIVITDDRQGTAQELADRLGDLDVKTVLVQDSSLASGASDFAADLGDPDAVAALIERVRKTCGAIAGLIHLLPLAEPAEGELPGARAWREVKSLYLVARGLERDLRESGKAGTAVLFSVTAMGGTMGFGDDLPSELPVGHGGVAGLTKSLSYEWPEVIVRVVDIDNETPATRTAELLLAELAHPDGPPEVGRSGDRRVTWQIEPGPLPKGMPLVDLGPESTVLITGGARGITARVALELAQRYKPRLVLAGSSALPEEESSETSGLADPAKIKAALMAREPEAKPSAIEATYRRLMKDREIRANLDAIRAAGSTVEYRAVDVRDESAFGALLDELNGAGGIAGVIHGAGVIEDKLLKDKTPDSFDRVFGTKVDSALALARKLDPAKLKFFAMFASITSRYGNRGQADYAAANEVLSKLACDLDRRWPGRVVSIAWGPWAEVGMVAELEKHLVARGLKLIEPAIGAGFAVDEIIFGPKGQPEVLIAGGSEQAARPAQATSAGTPATVGAE